MQNRLVRKGLVVGIIWVLVLVCIPQSIDAEESPLVSKTKLTIRILPKLLLSSLVIFDEEIQVIAQDIIRKLIAEKAVSVDEIHSITQSHDMEFDYIGIQTRVKTTKRTNACMACFPGNERAMWFGAFGILKYYAKFSYIWYDTNGYGKKEWHLTFDRDLVSEDNGYIIGFTGTISNALYVNPPYAPANFDLNGIGLIVFHDEFGHY